MSQSHTRKTAQGDTEYFDGTYWMADRDTCHHCEEECEANNKPYAWADQQFSFGVYAGIYCEACWKKSGYRDATDPEAEWSPEDCGEVMYEDQY